MVLPPKNTVNRCTTQRRFQQIRILKATLRQFKTNLKNRLKPFFRRRKKNLFSVQKTPSPYSPCVPLPSAAPLQTLTTTRQGSGCRGLRSWRSTEQPRTRLAPALSEPGGSSSAVWAARRFSRRTETFRQTHTRRVLELGFLE